MLALARGGHRGAAAAAAPGAGTRLRHGAAARGRAARARHPQSRQARGDRGAARALRHCDGRRRRARPARARGDRRDLRGECRAEGARGGAGERAAGARRRFRAGRCRRSAARPASIPRAGPGPARDFAAAMRRVEAELGARDRARRISSPCWRWPGPTAMSRCSAARCGRTRLAAARRRAASATTRSSCPTGTALTFGEMDPAAKARDQPPRRGLRASSSRAALPRCDAARTPPVTRALRPLAVLQVEMPLLRLQQPCARRRRRGALARGAAGRTRPLRGADAGAGGSPRSSSAAARRR